MVGLGEPPCASLLVMCRLFGFRSVMESRVHRSLVSADNALIQQSDRHPDGWGVAYFVAGAPHVIKSVDTAVSDHLFRRVSGVATSNTVLAHLRRATQGSHSIVDTHPFQYGSWVFAHNGNVSQFESRRSALLARIDDDLRRFILGDADSEVVFYALLTRIRQHAALHDKDIPLRALATAVREAVADVCEIAGELHPHDDGPPDLNYLTFILTNGETMIAHQGGKALYVSTHKTACSERDACDHYRPSCERFESGTAASHIQFSSEPLHGENHWEAMVPGEMIIADRQLMVARVPPAADLSFPSTSHTSLRIVR